MERLESCARLSPIRTSTSSRFNRSLLRKARVRFISFWTITQRPKRFSNINYGYCGTEAVANASILIFGGRCRCDSGVFLPKVCINYADDVLSEPLLNGEDLG